MAGIESAVTIPSKQEIKDEVRRLVSACCALVEARLKTSGYRFDAAADRCIREYLSQLLAWVDKGELHQAEGGSLGENVIQLRPRK